MKNFAASALALSLIAISGCAEAESKGRDMKRADVEKIIQEYLMENPEILREALIELDKKEDRAALAAVSDALFKDPRDVSIGPKDAKVTIVEFFDYNCGFCKNSSDWLKGVMDKYPDDVRVVFKELPILDGRTKTSRNAAKAALAAARQGKYTTMHFSMMNERSLTKDRVLAIAEKAGLSMEKLKKDMEDPEMDRQLEDGLLLANRIPSLTGTPFFVINDDFIAGADTKRLDKMLEDALKNS
ncbi:DsbA family protein [Hellea balneolensis]|uniref:DsbA family protein n=1 Tax=Hellea balneolensis TaxID=287478 RepID=UPI000425802C|nr:DsbA family protein [Hellea balneolensis]